MTAAQNSKCDPLPSSLPYAEVVFNLPLSDKFTYKIPDHLLGLIEAGMRVFVPFGRRRITGYVVDLTSSARKDIALKSIESISDSEPVVSTEILELTAWMAGYYGASWGEAIKAAIPAGLDEEAREHFSLAEDGLRALENESLPDKTFALLETLRQRPGLTLKQLQNKLKKQFAAHLPARMKKEGYLSSEVKIKSDAVSRRREKFVRLLEPQPPVEEIDKRLKRSPRQKQLYESLRDSGEQSVSSLRERFPKYAEPLKQLQLKNLAGVSVKQVSRDDALPAAASAPLETPPKLTADQEKVYRTLVSALDAGRFEVFLLHGITGSGKTEIYLRCIQRMLDLGKGSIMLVPEISLTPQTVGRFKARFGQGVAVLHSGLSQRERYGEWKRIREGSVSIVVGARSAIFAPFKNLGLIVVDEEHDASYKQESAPRYHARDTAIVRARMNNATVILGSATPALETRHNAETGKYQRLSLPRRIGDAFLPLVEIVDMREERKAKNNFSILSISLINGIRRRLKRGEQTFIFLNRRGAANQVFCQGCGFVYHCPHCSVTLTLHRENDALRCHYCNHAARLAEACVECGDELIRFRGFGTQKLQEEVQSMFPGARVARMDRDAMHSRNAFDDMFRDMTSGAVDILIGTQMITKGHDFPKVTLVGVVNADLALNIPDFRSSERAFQLLTQVAGRAGRGETPGQVVVQTFNPEHYVYRFVQSHDYEGFYAEELQFRERLNYPPYSRMAAFEIDAAQPRQAEALARRLKGELTRALSGTRGAELLGPSPAALFKLKNRFRWHLILRATGSGPLQAVLKKHSALRQGKKKLFPGANLTLDVDPVNLL